MGWWNLTFKCHQPVSVIEAALVKLANEILKSTLDLLSVNTSVILLALWAKVVAEEDALLVESRHFDCLNFSTVRAMFCVTANLARNFWKRLRKAKSHEIAAARGRAWLGPVSLTWTYRDPLLIEGILPPLAPPFYHIIWQLTRWSLILLSFRLVFIFILNLHIEVFLQTTKDGLSSVLIKKKSPWIVNFLYNVFMFSGIARKSPPLGQLPGEEDWCLHVIYHFMSVQSL